VHGLQLQYFLVFGCVISWDRAMRELAMEMLKAVQKKAISLFFDYEIARFMNGSPMVRRVVREIQGAK